MLSPRSIVYFISFPHVFSLLQFVLTLPNQTCTFAMLSPRSIVYFFILSLLYLSSHSCVCVSAQSPPFYPYNSVYDVWVPWGGGVGGGGGDGGRGCRLLRR